MKILITGAAGFLGSHLARNLLNCGNSVICVDNLITGCEDNIKDLLGLSEFKFINQDVAKPLHIEEDLDWVMHLASPASPKYYLKYPIKTLKAGTLGTHNCLGIAKKKNARFLLTSTSEIYGDPLVHPQTEEYFGNVNCVGPRSCYDESKRVAEAMTCAYQREHNITIRILRIFNTYGPLMQINDGRVISNFICQALTDKDITIYGKGLQTRSFCYVDDLIDGIIKFMEVDYCTPLNLGNPQEISILEVAKQILRLTNSDSKIKFLSLPKYDPRMRKPDISKAKKLLDWEPRVSLEQGLIKTISWFRNKLTKEGKL